MTGPDPETPDFTLPRIPKRFRCGGEEFVAPPLLAPSTLRRFATVHQSLVAAQGDSSMESVLDAVVTKVGDMMGMLMPGPYGKRFRQRLLAAPPAEDAVEGEEGAEPVEVVEPIDLQGEAMPALYWLMEKYGLRPTQPSSPSPNGLTDEPMDTPSGGISSTAGASAEASHI